MTNNNLRTPYHALTALLAITAISLLLTACGSSSGTGEDTRQEPPIAADDDDLSNVAAYNLAGSPAPNTNDVQAYMLRVWSNIVDENRCGACHSPGVGQEPLFARSDDINLAYESALNAVNLEAPASSLLVTQVATDHHCWPEATATECAADMEQWITNWATDTIGNSGATVQLTAPSIHEVDNTKVLPTDVPAQYDALHKLLTENCSSCHIESATNAQSPFISSSIPQDSYNAVRSKIDLADEGRSLSSALSRIVVRLRSESHNCWSSSCIVDAQELLDAINVIAGGISSQEVDDALKISKGVQLGNDGLPANSGGRHEPSMIARWEFKEGEGFTTRDTSGIQPLMDLQFDGEVSWVGGWGIKLDGGRALATSNDSKKLFNLIAESGEYTIEAWVAPNNVTQEGPSRIISYSAGNDNRNFLLGQTQYNYNFLHRSENSDDTGNPSLSTADEDEKLQASLQHVVVTYKPQEGRKIYVNGEFTGDEDTDPGVSISNWDNNYQFSLGAIDTDFSWAGVIRMVTIHNRALTTNQVQQNFDVGVGQKFLLLFNITDLVEIGDCWDSYIVFEASEYDSYSYLFNQPYFARLYNKKDSSEGVPSACTAEEAPEQSAYDFPIRDMRLGINGKIEATGQGYQELFVPNVSENLQVLSNIGTIYSQQNGVDDDQFFLAFEQIADKTGVYTDPAAITPASPIATTMPDQIGLRTFDEINASLESMTTIEATTPSIAALYTEIKQQLPVSETIRDFVPAHQMAIAQLAMLYCSELVDDVAKRSVYFNGFDFGASPNTAFDSTLKRNLVYTPLISRMSAPSVTTNLSLDELTTPLDQLLFGVPGRAGLTTCTDNCNAERTQTIVKALCAATAGSAIMLIQ